jgi:hypothetical protein
MFVPWHEIWSITTRANNDITDSNNFDIVQQKIKFMKRSRNIEVLMLEYLF